MPTRPVTYAERQPELSALFHPDSPDPSKLRISEEVIVKVFCKECRSIRLLKSPRKIPSLYCRKCVWRMNSKKGYIRELEYLSEWLVSPMPETLIGSDAFEWRCKSGCGRKFRR